MTSAEVHAIVVQAILTLNQGRAADQQIPTDPAAPLYGSGATLDSLGLVSLVIDVEEALDDHGVRVSLSDERALSQRESPFRTIDALVRYVLASLEGRS
jgi:acyl carrier protein